MRFLANLFRRSSVESSREQHTIDRLLKALGHRDDYVRLAAVQELETLGDPRAVEALAAALGDRSASVRLAAVQALGALGERRAVRPICALLNDKHPGVRLAAARALGALGDPRAAVPLAAALKDTTLGVRLAAVQALGALGEPWAAVPLAAALKDRDLKIREAVVRALSAIGDPAVVVPLCAALKDPACSVRALALSALRERRDARAVVSLCGVLAGADRQLRGAAAAALGELGDPRAVAPLCAALDDADIDVRSAAALALGQLKDPRAIEPLCAALARHRFHVHVLLWALRRRNRTLRRAAVEALGSSQQAATEITALAAARSDSDPEVRRAAIAVLNTLGARVGRLRTDPAEQQRLKDCLAQLPVVDVARWALLSGARFGPMTPGDDAMVERSFKSPEPLVQFLIAEKPTLRVSWSTIGEALVVEYFYQATGRLNGRFVVLRHGKPAEYLCYLAWLVEHHGSYETVQLQALAS